jgi:hypothetical protein
VLFRDGAEVRVQDWTFRYEFGVRDTPDPLPNLAFYYKHVKTSPALQLEELSTARGVTTRTPYVIGGDQIRCIRYEWTQSTNFQPNTTGGVPGPDQLSEIAVETHDGAIKTFNTSPNVSDSFLAERGYTFSESLYLVGKVRDDRGNLNDFSWLIGFSYVVGDKKEQVDTICFE